MTDKKEQKEVTSLEGSISRETEKAILFKFNDSENWLPKSQVKVKNNKNGCVVEIPNWLWVKMNQIEESV